MVNSVKYYKQAQHKEGKVSTDFALRAVSEDWECRNGDWKCSVLSKKLGFFGYDLH